MALKVGHLNCWQAFFSDRYFNVTIGNLNSNDNCVLTGVPQGSILSPLLVGMSSSEHVQTLMYADYLSIITLADIIELETSRLQCGITKLDKWLRYQGFQLITDKSVIWGLQEKSFLYFLSFI